jgi:chemotaxis protein histidine kinase CheA/CheY-like chemotaxis protein
MQPEQQQRIMGYFIEEAKDHLNTIEQGLLNLQGTLDDSEMVNEVFRAAHSVKGGAAMLGLSGIQQTSHQLEDYFKILKETPGIRADQKLETLLLQVSDTLSGLLEQLQSPFGLTDEASETAINNAKPVFREIEQHLKHLTSIATPGSAPRSGTTASAQTLIFQQQVPIVLRDLLELFKQLDGNPALRKTLQARCDELISVTAPFQVSGWNNLLGMVCKAVDHTANSGRIMAGVIIKDLKQAQELVLANQGHTIVPSTALMNLVPLTATHPVDTALLSEADDLFGRDLFGDDLFTQDTTSNESADLDFDGLDFDGLDFDGLDLDGVGTDDLGSGEDDALFSGLDGNGLDGSRQDGLTDLNLDATGSQDEFAALLDDSGPEMGMAELNSLADLFEGEVPDLSSTWQQEEVIRGSRNDSLALNLSSEPTSSDFEAFLLEPESVDETLTDQSLDDLFGDDLLADLSEPDTIASPSTTRSDDGLDLAFLDEMDFSTSPPASMGDDLGLSMLDNDFGSNLGTEDLSFDDLPSMGTSASKGTGNLSEDASSSLHDLGDLFMGLDGDELSFESELGELNLSDSGFSIDDLDDLNLSMESLDTAEIQTNAGTNTGGTDFEDLFSFTEETPPPSDRSRSDDLLGISELFGGDVGVAHEDPLTLLDLTDPDAESDLFHDLNNPLFSEGLESDTEMQFDPDLRLNSLDSSDNDWTMVGSEFDQFMQGGPEEPDVLSNLDEFDDLEGIMGLDDDLESNLDSLGDLDGFLDLSASNNLDLETDVETDLETELKIDLGADLESDLGVNFSHDPWGEMGSSPPVEPMSNLDFSSEITQDDMDLPMDLWADFSNDLDLPQEPSNDHSSDRSTEDSSDQDALGGLDLLFGGAAIGAVGLGAATFMQSRATSPEITSPEITSPEITSPEITSPEITSPESALDLNPDFNLDNLSEDDLNGLDHLDFGLGLGSETLDDIDLDDVNKHPESEQDFGDLDRLLNAPEATPLSNAQDPFMDLEELLSANADLPMVAIGGAGIAAAVGVGAAMSASSPLDDPEFDDLERLLEDTDKSSGAAGNRGIVAPRRTVRPSSKGFSEQTMRVPVKHLDNLSNLVGELVVNRNSLEQDQERLRQSLDNLLYQVQQLSDVGQRMQDLYERSLLESSLLASRQSYRMAGSVSITPVVDPERSNDMEYDPLEMDRFTGFHSLSQEMIELIVRVRESASDIEFIVDETDQVTRNFRQVTTQLQEGLTRSRMVPFAQTADRLPRAVRDIAMKCGKQAELVIEGRETPIDKMLLEHLYDPMTHLVNNAITHGIETPEERRRAGKPETGRITIRAFHQGNQTVISVSDDGAGVDIDHVKKKAVQKNLITAAESQTMGRLDVYDLLFHPGFSTRDQADDFAGRGVGMDVVRTSLSEIRGAVTTDSGLGKGTTFTIRLPLTLSISKALCCISDRARIAFPMDGVEDMLDMPKDRVQTNAEGQPCITWRDTQLLLRPLTELLAHNRHLGRGNVYGGSQEEDMISIVVLRSAGNYLALQVDQVLGEQEIVIKQLEGPVPKPVGVAGATVLGDGRIMPIADVLELIDLSIGRIRRDSGSMWDQGNTVPVEALPIKTEPMVLIVDDSITVRELLSMTFNKVGYRVEQARDGQEAWEKLRSGLPCDIVFCDIEMPRMDGLELLSRIQKDPALKALPIAMLTSRGADRHRQMASSLGASGYFTKPYLEEALLDAAARMLKGEVLLIADKDE